MKKFLVLAALFVASISNASTTRDVQADTIHNTGGSSLAVPSTGGNVISDTATQSLSNKTLSAPVLSGTVTGTYTLGGTPTIPASAISSGMLGVANGGTGLATITAHTLLFGAGTSAPTLSAVGASNTVLHGNTGADPSYGAVSLTADVSGILPSANGGTGVASPTSGSVYIGAGSSPMTAVAPGTSGNVLTSNGSTWVSSAASSGGGTSNVVASPGSPQLITAGTAVAVTGQIVNGPNVIFVAGNTAPVTVTAVPSITACTAAGEYLTLIGESATNTVTLQDNAGLSGSKLQLNGNVTLGLNSSISFVCDAASGNWVETSRR